MRIPGKRKFGWISPIICCASLIIAIGTGCGEKEDDEKDAATELEGTWKTGCLADADGGFMINTFTAEGNNFLWVMGMYTTASCVTNTLNVVMSGTFVVGDEVTEPVGAKKIDNTVSKVTATMETEEAITQMGSGLCTDVDDWEVGVAKDITGKTCSQIPTTAGDVMYDIYKVDSGNLYFGDEDTGAGDSDTTRATALDTHGVFTK